MSYDRNDYMIAWDVQSTGGPRVEVGPWPDKMGWSDDFALTTGCSDAVFHDLSEREQAQALLNQAADLMFSGIAPRDVIREFAKIRTWREMGVNLPAGYCSRAFLSTRPNWNPHNPE